MINTRERVLAVLQGKMPDQVPWLGDLDYWYSAEIKRGTLPDKYLGEGLFQMQRDLGVGFYLQGYFPFTPVYEGVKVSEELTGDRRLTRVETPAGELRAVEKYLPDSYCWAYQEHFVKGWRDLPALRAWYEHTHYQPDYARAARRYDLVGGEGVVLCYLPRSPFMEMTAVLAGIQAVTEASVDATDEFEASLAVLRRKGDEAVEIAVNSPAECLMIPENLSSETVGKRFYLKYVRPTEQDWLARIHAAHKFSFIHMDGTLRGLIREVAETGFNVIEAATPAPVGDLSIGDIQAWTGPNTVIWGGLPGLYFTDLVDDETFDRFVISVLEVMRSRPRHVLGVADQVPPGARWERIRRVSELVERYGNTG